MEWVLSLLAVGCLFFAAQVVIDYYRYKRAIEPRLERADELREELQGKIEHANEQLEQTQSTLEPAREEVAQLEREYSELQDQVRLETDQQRPTRPNTKLER
jgi:septal ring factor EnvC (AmiA/AmiB activator)